MSTSCGTLWPSLLLCAALAACSATTDGSIAGSPSGGSNQTSGGSANSVGGSAASVSGGSASSAGSSSAAGAASTVAGSNAGGESFGGAGDSSAGGGDNGFAGSSSRAGASSGGANAGGAAGAVGSGGTGGKVDQGSLPSISIHMAGDSTMSNYPSNTTQEGWGQEFGQYFIAKVTIDNQALPGSNVQTFYNSRWKTLIGNVKAGDYVMAAFGTNDSGTTHGPVSLTDFKAEFSQMAAEVAMKKATFILTTPSALQIWSGTKINNSRLQPYCDVLTTLGMSTGLLVDDLNARGVEYYDSIGPTAALALSFNGDKAHFDKQGATEMALLASQELKRINSPLAAYLK